MPELPEVETTRSFIEPVLTGTTIVRAQVTRARMARHNEHPDDVTTRLVGSRVESVGRVGKFIVIELDNDLSWVIHLGMSGRIRVSDPGQPMEAHTNFFAATDRGPELRLIDPRTFGFVAVFTPDELTTSGLGRLGPDALEALPRTSDLQRLFAARSAPIKSTLLNQSVVSGLGNIYADEALFLAKIHPLRPANTLSKSEISRLGGAIKKVLAAGLAHGGTSLQDLAYLLPDGRAGEYMARLSVYGRTGQPCTRCHRPVERIVLGQRSSHFCSTCQI